MVVESIKKSKSENVSENAKLESEEITDNMIADHLSFVLSDCKSLTLQLNPDKNAIKRVEKFVFNREALQAKNFVFISGFKENSNFDDVVQFIKDNGKAHYIYFIIYSSILGEKVLLVSRNKKGDQYTVKSSFYVFYPLLRMIFGLNLKIVKLQMYLFKKN